MNELIDLTYPLEEGMLTFGAHWHPKVRIQQLGRLDIEGRESRQVTLGTHTGTHVDAPTHFLEGAKTIDQLPLQPFIGPVTILDLSHLGRDGVVTAETLKGVELGERTIIRYGWGKYWGDRERYYHHYPHFTEEAAKEVISRGVKLLGYDTCSPDDSRAPLKGGDDDSPMHKLLLGNGVVLVEYLANLDTIPDPIGWTLTVLPLRIRGADGAPARAVIYR